MDDFLKKIDVNEDEFVELTDEDFMEDSNEFNEAPELPKAFIQKVVTTLNHLAETKPEVLDEVLKELTKKEEMVIRVSCGLSECTIDEFLKKHEITNEDFSRVFKTAICKLGHPSRMRKMKEAQGK